MNLNKVQLIGRLGKDVETRHLESGQQVNNFSVAVTESYKDKQDQWQEQTEWVNVVKWKECKLEKGDLVYIEGKLKTRSWEKDGVTRYVTEVVAQVARRLNKRQHTDPMTQTTVETDDNMPF